MVLIFSVELISGLLLKFMLGTCPWNYVSKGRAILGIITLDYALVWFAVGIAFERIHDTIIHIESSVKLNSK